MEIGNIMQKVAVIGGDVSGLSVAQMLKSKFQVTFLRKRTNLAA